MRYRLAAFADEASSSLDGQITAMRKNGIGLLEIRGVDGENISEISPAKAREIRNRLDDSGISVWSLGSPYGKINIGDDFEAHLDSFKRSLETADILNARHIRLFSFYGASEIDEVLPKLEGFIDAAKGTDIVLCHENEKGIFGDTANKCLELHKALPGLKAVFDPANFIQCGQDTVKAWEMLSPYVEYMHIKDALPDGSVVPAGKGVGEIPYILERYKGEVLTVEPHLSVFGGFEKLEKEKHFRFCYSDPREAFDAAANALKDLIGG